MSCALTQGYTLDCSDGVGGIAEVSFIEHEWLTNTGTTITASGGTISNITIASSKKFWKYQLPSMNKDYAKENIVKNNEAGTLYWDQEIQLTLRKLSPSLRNEIRLLAQNRLGVIVKDHNSNYWLYGQLNGVELEPSESTTGTGRGEFNGYILKFKGQEEAPAQSISSSLIASITY